MKKSFIMIPCMQIGTRVFAALILLSSLIFIHGCGKSGTTNAPELPDTGNYVLTATYDSIRSYPGGGGIFIVRMKPEKDFAGTVQLHLEADIQLHAELSRVQFNAADTVTEVLIHPDMNAAIKGYEITVVASHGGTDQKRILHASMMEWTPPATETAISKLDLFRKWLSLQGSSYLEVFDPQTTAYGTYPQILVVEHYTFLTPHYEFRLCYHVMIPPYDWSMIRVRRRTSPVAELAARRESDGSIRVISVQKYPVFDGY